MSDQDWNRREILSGLTGAAVASSQFASAATTNMPHRDLGRTGQKVSCIGLGGAHIRKPKLSEAESIRLIRQALDRGMNFMDNSWDYNEGQSEPDG